MKIFKLIIFTTLLSVIQACDVSEFQNEFSGKNFVFFSVSSLSLGEGGSSGTTVSGTPITYPSVAEVVVNRSGDASNALTVNIDLDATFVTDSDFFEAGDDATGTFDTNFETSVVIPAGAYSTKFTVTAVNDLLSSGNKLLKFTITGTSDNAFTPGVPGGAVPRNILNFTITDDDCPINLTGDWGGTYTVEDVAPAGSTNAGLSLKALGFYAGGISLAADATDAAGITALLSNSGGGFLPVGNTSIVFNTCPKTLTVPNPFNLGFNVNGSQARITTFREVIFNPDTKTLIIRGTLINAGGLNFGSWDLTFTKN
jgi:hypothetical protein